MQESSEPAIATSWIDLPASSSMCARVMPIRLRSSAGASPFFCFFFLPPAASAGSTSISSQPSETTGSSNCEIW